MAFDLSILDDLSDEARSAIMIELTKKMDNNKLLTYTPYKKQAQFHTSTGDLTKREFLLIAGNQLGKTWCAAYMTAMHLTGLYPEWWEGKKFLKPVTGWAASNTSMSTRDTVQRLLLGEPGQWGTGAIPKSNIIEIKRAAHGVSDAVDTILVRHTSGGQSRVTIKTYDSGRARWQGESLEFVWFDEEPPADIYMEGLTRTNARDGIVWITFTPLQGMSDVVKRFLVDKSPGTSYTQMTIEDVEHYSEEKKAQIIAAYPAHEREARANGTPTMGSGRVFPIEEAAISEKAIAIPAHWPRICAIDFGWDHPTALVWLAWDRDSDTVHLYDCYRAREAVPAVTASAWRQRGEWIKVAWPHDGLQHDKGSGEELSKIFARQGMKMLPEKVTFVDGGNSVEAGLLDMLERMQSGRFKVAKHLNDFFEEFRMYHRKDGKLVKVDDDILSATRYAIMALRFSTVQSALSKTPRVQPLQPVDASMGMLGF